MRLTGLLVVLLSLPCTPAEAQLRLETLDERSALRSDSYRTPCFSANILGTTPIEITEQALANRLELRLRAVRLNPVPFEKCDLPGSEAPTATRQQTKTLWLNLEPFFRDDGTFTVQLRVFRLVRWQVTEPRPSDDGFRGRMVSVDSYTEPSLGFARNGLRHEGRATVVLEAVDRLADDFLVDYLRQNQQ